MIRRFLSKKRRSRDDFDEMPEAEDEYVELNTNYSDSSDNQKVVVRPFVIDDFVDVKPVLDALREGNTVCLLNIKPLREKDIVELKRAINKIKKTIEAVSGDIAGFGEDYIIVAPGFAKIYRDSAVDDLDD
ncbi:MAG: cell division protein SepF [Candidatus Woesearchaeota archaeon]